MLLRLGEREALNPQAAGGKGAGLARLAHSGLRVPQTVVVSTAAWTTYAAHPLVAGRIDRLLAALPEQQEAAYTDLRTAVRSVDLPKDLLDGLRDLLPTLGGRLACRSSAVVEDGAERSFAGLLTSYLAIESSLRSVSAAIKGVWLSLLAPRTLAYLEASGVADVASFIREGCAVLLQELVPTDRAGVMFRRPGQLRIEAVYGLGLALVSGKASPDVFQWLDGRWHRQVEQYKRIAVVPAQGEWSGLLTGDEVRLPLGDGFYQAHFLKRDGGLALVRPAFPYDAASALTESECTSLAVLADDASEAVGFGEVDVEWGWHEGRPILLQARRITVALPTSHQMGSSDVATGAADGITEGELWSPRSGQAAPGRPFILYVPEVTPADITHVSRAVGVIAQMGGTLSHGAILCRELGKPMVILRREARDLVEGQQVRINGATGEIGVVASRQ